MLSPKLKHRFLDAHEHHCLFGILCDRQKHLPWIRFAKILKEGVSAPRERVKRKRWCQCDICSVMIETDSRAKDCVIYYAKNVDLAIKTDDLFIHVHCTSIDQ